MATPYVSAGAYTREIDQSLYVQQLSDTAIGVVGTAQWGPTNVPTLITSANQLVNTFGNPTGGRSDQDGGAGTPQHPMYYTLLQFFRKARRAWVVRVANSDIAAAVDLYATPDPSGSMGAATAVVKVRAKYTGSFGNNIRLRITAGTKGPAYRKLQVFVTSPKDATKMALTETFDNLTIADSAAADSWKTKTDASNYITASITVTGRQPDAVSGVIDPALVSVDPNAAGGPAGSALAAASPALVPGDTFYQLSGGDDGDAALTDADFTGTVDGGPNGGPSGLHCFDNAEAFVVNLVAVPGPQKRTNNDNRLSFDSGNSSAIVDGLINLCELRGDCMALIDPPFGLTPTGVAFWTNGDFDCSGVIGDSQFDGASIDSNLIAAYYPWVQLFDEFSGQNLYLPPSAFASEAIANTDFTTDPWFAPAGLNRARIDNAIRAERTLTLGERDYLYSGDPNIINPIATFQGTGLVIWGQRTMQRTHTSLDRINVRRMLLVLRKLISTALQSLVFEPNDPTMWRRFRGLVTPFLQAVQNRRGITQFRVIMDESTNTPDIIEQNMAVGKVFIQPTKTAEIIVVDFVLTPQGAAFQEIVNSLGGSVAGNV